MYDNTTQHNTTQHNTTQRVKWILVLIFVLPIWGFAQTGPGGVGTTDGTSTLELWLSAEEGVTTQDTFVTNWSDQSGNGNDAVPPTVAARPTYTASSVNGYPALSFDDTNDELHVPDDASLDITNWDVFVVPKWGGSNNDVLLVKGADANENIEMLVYADSSIHAPIDFSTGRVLKDFPTNSINTHQFNVMEYVYDGSGRSFYKNLDNTYSDADAGIPQVNNNPLYIGNEQGISGRFYGGEMAEIVIYSTPLNSAQRIIVNNYLAAKYAQTLVNDDLYVQDNTANGNYDHDVAGIGRVDASNTHTDAMSSTAGISGAAGLDNGEFLLFGHDNGSLGAINTTDIPGTVQRRLERVWRVSEVNTAGSSIDVGAIDVRFDLSGVGAIVLADLRLLIDTDNDGVFTDETPIAGATSLGGDVYEFGGVTAITDGVRFTLGTTTADGSAAFRGPGGVGAIDGSSSLRLWLRAEVGALTSGGASATNGEAVATWSDQSGHANNATASTGGVFTTSVLNTSYPVIRFTGNDNQKYNVGLPTVNNESLFVVGNERADGNNSFVDDGQTTNKRRIYSYESGSINNPSFFSNVGGGFGINNSTDVPLDTTFVANWEINAAADENYWVDGGFMGSAATGLGSTNFTDLTIGGHPTIGISALDGDIGEIVGYDVAINSAQRIIVTNYLAAKYRINLSSDDVYTQDDVANGNYDHDVAGIGRVDASNEHAEARGTGIIRVLNPSGLGNNEFFLWGHDGGLLDASESSDVPSDVERRLDRVWRVSEVNSSGTAVDVGSIDIQFDLSGLDPFSASDLRLIIDTDNDGVFSDETPIAGATAAFAGENTFQFTGVSGLSDGLRFTLGTINRIQSALPVEFTDFTAHRATASTVLLEWQTAMELNNEGFVIERSADGQPFEAIGFKAGQGTSNELNNYAHTDYISNNPGSLCYRLKQVDFDGNFAYSKVVCVDQNTTHQRTKLNIYPNPTKDGTVHVAFEGSGRYELQVIRPDGVLVHSQKIENSQDDLKITELQPGVYFFRALQGNGFVSVQRVVIQ